MNYKLQIHFLNFVTTWRAHVLALINIVIIKSPFLHQCRLHSNGNGFKIVQKSFIKSSSNLQEANHLGFTCQQLLLTIPNSSNPHFIYKNCLKFQKETRWPILKGDLCSEIIKIPSFGKKNLISFTIFYYSQFK